MSTVVVPPAEEWVLLPVLDPTGVRSVATKPDATAAMDELTVPTAGLARLPCADWEPWESEVLAVTTTVVDTAEGAATGA